MEYETDSVDGPHYPDVAELARELVRKSINGLDSLVLQQRLQRNRIKENPDLSFAEGCYAVLDSTGTSLGVYRRAAGRPATLAVEGSAGEPSISIVVPAGFPPQMRFECLLGMSGEVPLSRATAVLLLDQKRS